MGDIDMSVDDVREHARRSALAGREVWCNPHIGGEAEIWREGYCSVPEEQRGTQPELLAKFRAVHARKRKSTRAPKAFGMAIKASVEQASARMPKPWTEL